MPEYIGRLHPLTVHLPITLLFFGGVLEILRLKAKAHFFSDATLWCFGLGALTALAATSTGWILEEHSHPAADEIRLLHLHKLTAIATTLGAVASFAAEFYWRNSAKPA